MLLTIKIMPRQRQTTRVQRNAEVMDRMRKKLAATKGPKTICLTMIVRNESKNMDRLLSSVKSIIDMISIVDTGSDDNTEEIILLWAKKYGIPAVVHHEPFKNFSYNRTHSIRVAKQSYPNADYFLLSDADFVWEVDVGGKFDKALLIDHKYLIEQYNKSLSYWNIRLLSSKIDFECVGATHEYWSEAKNQTEYAGEVRVAKIKTLVIDDKEDGGCKSDKFERDERLLRNGLEDPDTPNNLKSRYKFYLAQTLKDMGRNAESNEWYIKRVEDRGWAEEVFYSKFQIGFNHEQQGWKKKHAIALMGKSEKSEEDLAHLAKWNPNYLGPAELIKESTNHFTDASVNYLAAHTFRKTRAESLYYLSRMYRLLSMNEMSYNIAVMGKKIKYPDNDTLFIERSCYTYLFDYEISIVAFFLPTKKDLGRQAIARLLDRDDLPESIRTNVESNSRQYI